MPNCACASRRRERGDVFQAGNNERDEIAQRDGVGIRERHTRARRETGGKADKCKHRRNYFGSVCKERTDAVSLTSEDERKE